MKSVELRVGAVILVTLAAYTMVANVIPQVQSDVPRGHRVRSGRDSGGAGRGGRSPLRGRRGCLACHAESPGARGPNLLTDYRGQGLIGERCADRVPGLDCKAYLHQALVGPQAQMVEGLSAHHAANRPDPDTGPRSGPSSPICRPQGGEVTVTGADIQADRPGGRPMVRAAPPSRAAPSSPNGPGDLPHRVRDVPPGGWPGGPAGPPGRDRGPPLGRGDPVGDPGSRRRRSPGYEDMAGLMPPTSASS
jgi:hypothetical protein